MTPPLASRDSARANPGLGGRALRFLVTVAVVNGILCIVAHALVLSHARGPEDEIGATIYVLAAAALALTPIQLVVMWMVLGRRLKELYSLRRTRIRIEKILGWDSIPIAFQPIVDIQSGSLSGVEALARFPLAPERSPVAWFADADLVDRASDLELLAIRSALACADDLPPSAYIAVNVSPPTLVSERLLPILHDSGVSPDRIVLEVTEHCSVPDYSILRKVRADLALEGIRLAVDDAGSGYASFRHIVTLAPDIIKIDRDLVRGIDHDPARQSLVAAVVMFADHSGASVVGEGVETLAELEPLATLGVGSVQGFLLARPSTNHEDWAAWGDRIWGQVPAAAASADLPPRS